MQINDNNQDVGKNGRPLKEIRSESAVRKDLLNNMIREFFTNDNKIDKEEKKMLKEAGYSRKEIKQAEEEYKVQQNDIQAKKQEIIERCNEMITNNPRLGNINFGLENEPEAEMNLNEKELKLQAELDKLNLEINSIQNTISIIEKYADVKIANKKVTIEKLGIVEREFNDNKELLDILRGASETVLLNEKTMENHKNNMMRYGD